MGGRAAQLRQSNALECPHSLSKYRTPSRYRDEKNAAMNLTWSHDFNMPLHLLQNRMPATGESRESGRNAHCQQTPGLDLQQRDSRTPGSTGVTRARSSSRTDWPVTAHPCAERVGGQRLEVGCGRLLLPLSFKSPHLYQLLTSIHIYPFRLGKKCTHHFNATNDVGICPLIRGQMVVPVWL